MCRAIGPVALIYIHMHLAEAGEYRALHACGLYAGRLGAGRLGGGRLGGGRLGGGRLGVSFGVNYNDFGQFWTKMLKL